jgi:capsule polysaccharide export protein KpsE/RkpR
MATPQIVTERDSQDSGGLPERSRTSVEFKIAQLRLLWSARRFLVRTIGIGFLAATLLAFLLPKSYESTARLMPPDNQGGLGKMVSSALAHTPGVDLGSVVSGLMDTRGQSGLFMGVLRSRSVQDQLLDEFHLQAVYGKKMREDARKRLDSETEISEDRKSGIISIKVTDRSPQRAAAMAGEYVTALNRIVSQQSTSSAHRERIFLEQRLAAVREDLNSAEKDFSQFASNNEALDVSEQAKTTLEASAILQGQIIAAQSQLEGLKQIYADNNVRVRSSKARIAELQSQLEMLNGVSGKESSAGEKKATGNQYPSLRELPILGLPFAEKYRALKIQEAVYDTLSKQYELAKVQEAKELPTVKILDQPGVPEKKSFPPRLLIISCATLATACLGVLWVFAMTRWLELEQGSPLRMIAWKVFESPLWPLPSAAREEIQTGFPTGVADSCGIQEAAEKEKVEFL